MREIKYVCLVMSEGYIRSHFDSIKDYANVVEQRLDDGDCTMESLLRDNKAVLEECQKRGIEYLLIDNVYEVDIQL